MDDTTIRAFLDQHPTTARWLDEIIDVLIDRRGVAHVRDIAADLVKSNKARDKDTTEQIVTRSINHFCSDALDFDKDEAPDLFERVEPATYRLRAFPARPNIIGLNRIEFDDGAMQSMWNWFRELARKKHPQEWRHAGTEKRLSAFVRWMARDRNNTEYEKRKAAAFEGEISLDALFAEPTRDAP